MKFSIKDFFSKCDQIRRKLRIWSRLLEKSKMENLIFCAAFIVDLMLLQSYKNTQKSCSILFVTACNRYPPWI